ncbi:peptidase S8/S53 domain-containing protein [Chaetomium tenue]|uniref:Peptidase S8/S53 domain-containing protein n=1 Tax=Chaetomium tenue TaxID=1854479 RepID=A0ACB7NXY2_9PEZI|nr:peptidase S8/S53 domain-containing protein [Chaetomium globosum]
MHFFTIVGLAAAIASPLASGAVTPPAPNLRQPPLPIPANPRSASAVVLARNNEVPEDLVIPDTYIIRYKPSLDVLRRLQHEEDVDRMAKNDAKRGIFDKFDIPGLQGYAAEISPSELKNLTECELIDLIEKDTIIKTTAVAASPALAKRTMVKQYNAPWGLARISHHSRNRRDYVYSDTAGTGTVVYVVDTGIRTSHADFDGRAIWGANFLAETSDSDEDGHGTHVAAIIAGSTYGVAKNATVIAVKVLDKTGTGSMSGLLRGLNWAVDDARRRGVVSKTVINMSVAGTYTQSVNDAIKVATDAGITVVAAAGNKNDDVANWSPGSAPTAITVGAIDEDDRRGEFSNWGPGVDIFAPGVSINSAYNTGDHETAWLSGTSMATPHVAGLAAYFMAREGLSGSEVTERILGAANKGVADRHDGADKIAYNGDGE